MPTANSARRIVNCFDGAAVRYDSAATLQAKIAKDLVTWAMQEFQRVPLTVLDLGCGTGFVSEAIHTLWPNAQLTAVDASAAMLDQTHHKIPTIKILQGDVTTLELSQSYDLIFSSMMLHWLHEPQRILQRWKKFLKPSGRLYAALLVDGSFKEWRDLCHTETQADGIWPFPNADFLMMSDMETRVENITVTYGSAENFLHHLKTIGAATPRPDYTPLNAGTLRRILSRTVKPFAVTYRVLFMCAAL